MITLDPHQREGVAFLSHPDYAGRLLADEMGLGKTMQAVAACAELRAQKILVLCPKLVRQHWKDHFKQFEYSNVGINTLATPVSIWNYDMLSHGGNLAKRIHKLAASNGGFDVLILDEAHLLANHDAKRTMQVFGIGGLYTTARRVMCLTGTPVLSSPANFYPMISRLWAHAFKDCRSFYDFAYKFCDAHYEGDRLVTTGSSNIEEFAKRLRGFMLRRTNVSVYQAHTPPKLLKIHMPLDLRGVEGEAENHITARRLGAEAKVPELLDTLGILAKHHGKLVAFCHHKKVMELVVQHYPHCAIICGGQTPTHRKQSIDRFIHGSHQLLVVQIRAGGTGLDGLQRVCNAGIFIEDDWTPAQIEQAMGRLDRRGQERPVVFYFVSVQASDIEGRMQIALAKKREIVKTILEA